MAKEKRRDKTKSTLSSMQEVTYSREFKMADRAGDASGQRGVVDSPVGGGGVMIWKATALLLGVIWGLLALLTLLEIYEETKALTVAVMLLVGFLIAYGMFELDQ